MKSFGEITGSVAIEMHSNSYIHALDTGLFTVGAPHKGADSICFILLLKCCSCKAAQFCYLKLSDPILCIIIINILFSAFKAAS